MMKRQFLSIVIIFICCILTNTVAIAAVSDYKATAKIDSAVMLMGSKAKMSVEFMGPLAGDARLELGSMTDPDIEITPDGSAAVTKLSGNRQQLKEEFTVQIFDSGLYTVPPVVCISGNDTVFTNSPVIKVDPMPLDSVNIVEKDGKPVDLKIHDYTDVENVQPKFFDFVPDWVQNYGWWILLAIVLVAAFVFVYLKWLRHGRIPLIPVKKPIPPYELAVSRLNKLQEEMLWQKGAEKEYYTRLTDILRGYLSGRFGINAMEMTTYQISQAIADNKDVSEYSMLINKVLNEADFVKFAKAKPLADENQRAFSNARQFVELTKPIVVQDDGNVGQNSKEGNKENVVNDINIKSE